MRHRGGGRGAMPVLFAWREPNHITGTDFLDGAAFTLRPSGTGRDNQRLAERMRMPGRARAGRKSDTGTAAARGLSCLKQRVDADRAGEIVGGPIAGRL